MNKRPPKGTSSNNPKKLHLLGLKPYLTAGKTTPNTAETGIHWIMAPTKVIESKV